VSVGGGVDEAGNVRLREEAKELLRAAHERQAVTWGKGAVQVYIQAEQGGRGLVPDGPRLAALVDYMEVVGWVEADPFARDAVEASARRITARGLQVIREGPGLGGGSRSSAGVPEPSDRPREKR
jgi:hypothetical protein